MKKVYKSKIGLEIVIPISIIFGLTLIMTMIEKPSWVGLIILLPVVLFIVHLFTNTDYTIDGETLTVRCGFLLNKKIDIQSIRKISETNNIISSPAISLDRLEVFFGKRDSIIISPKQKQEFINDILTLNPDVEVKYKQKKKTVQLSETGSTE